MASKGKEIKLGIIFSYLLILINMVYGLLVTPYILKYVGNESYGVYKAVSSISASLAVMDLGLTSTMTRYIARYRATGEKYKAQNFAGMIFVQLIILVLAIILVGGVLNFFIPHFYGNTFSSNQITLAKKLLAVLVLNMALRMVENLFFGILNGHERFIFSNGTRIINLVLKFSLIIFLLPMAKNVMLVVLTETLLVSATIIAFFVYFKIKLHFKFVFKKWDIATFKESFGYTLLMFVQSVTVQFNGNVDNIMIGSMQGPSFVTVYSMAIVIFGMYENLSGSIANIMLPKVTKKVVDGESSGKLQKFIEKIGRYQFMILAMTLGGFISLGKTFYNLWLGKSFSDCYYLVLILIIPVTFPMIQNVMLSILRAQNKMVYRTVTLVISCMFNIIITYFGIKLWGYWGAAVGTSCATILNLIMMNIYYHKYLNFKILKLFINIFKKIFPIACAATIITAVVNNYLEETWFNFIFGVIVFILIYSALLFLFVTRDEVKTILRKLRGK